MKKPKSSIKNLRLLLGIGLMALSVIAIQNIIGQAQKRSVVYASQRAIAAGQILTTEDFVPIEISVQSMTQYLTTIKDVAGKALVHDLQPGEFLTRNNLMQANNTRRLLSLPLTAGHIPFLTVGQRIDVWMSPAADGLAVPAPPHVVAYSAIVESIPEQFDPTIDTSITVSVTSDEIGALVEAIQEGHVDVAVVPDGNTL